MWKVVFVLSVLAIGSDSQKYGLANENLGLLPFTPCVSENIVILYNSSLPVGEENQYELHIHDQFYANSKMNVRFNTDVTVTSLLKTALVNAQPKKIGQFGTSIQVDFVRDTEVVILLVKGSPDGSVPYVESAVINNLESCDEPKKGFLDRYVEEARNIAQLYGTSNFDSGCGRRKILHIEQIIDGSPTRPGDWPWHVAIYRFERSKIDYICGGTLLNSYFILTAAHCLSSRGLVVLPETRNVVLGKYNLVGGDVAAQEKEVLKIIIHEGFDPRTVDRDIGLMKLKTSAEFTDYVQPACLWYANAANKVTQEQIFGTVVGWGFDRADSLSLTLQQVILPEMSDSTCIRSNPVFFSRKLDGTMFCAGFANGTSVCNGDSGGGFHIFVPDVAGNTAHDASGAWYVRGVVSVSVRRRDAAICDPESYALFTDLSKYGAWINGHIKADN